MVTVLQLKMWKYVTRRIRDTFERSANHFDKRSSTVINPSNSNLTEDKNKGVNSPCCWFISKKCWNTFQSENDTNSKRWNFEQLNRTWIGAITWSSALVFGWYTSQLIHLNLKKQHNVEKIKCLQRNSVLFEYLPFLTGVNKKNLKPLNLKNHIESPLISVPPTLHFISNDQNGEKNKQARSSTSSSENSDSDLGEVLNSIENKLGLAAIENGQHQDGLNLLRSAANRNHAPALYNLGLCYELGLGVAVNEKMAMELYKSAAALQHPGALYNLGIYYGQGRGGLTQDRVTATRLLRLAAIQGQEDAITALKIVQDETPVPSPNNTWTEQYLLQEKHDNIIPTHSALFIENVNNLHTCDYKYEPVVY